MTIKNNNENHKIPVENQNNNEQFAIPLENYKNTKNRCFCN